MKKSRLLWIFISGLVGLVSLGVYFWQAQKPIEVGSIQVVRETPGSISGFARADGKRPLVFPEDNGSHNDYQTEWWYFTGNLKDGSGNHYGYQLTFFRRALKPAEETPQRPSAWAANQVYLAHFALTDVEGKHFQTSERLERGAVGLAGAEIEQFQVWLDDWKVSETEPGVYQLHAADEAVSIDLSLIDVKGPILQGDEGYSRKGPQPGNASYYYSYPRLTSNGFIEINKERIPVEGLSWMDHEWSTSALSADQVGWDWFSLQLDNGSDLMFFQIRQTDGTIDPYSSGAVISPDGQVQHLTKEDFQIQPLETWKSPHNQAVYPAGWKVTIPELGIKLEITPYLEDQEINLTYTYWEGAVRVSGEMNGLPVSGDGYVELTGYAGSMGSEF